MSLIRDPRQQISNAFIIKAMEENLVEFIMYCSGIPGAQAIYSHDHIAAITGLPEPTLNVVMRTRLATSDIDQRIEEIIKPFQARNVPMLWYLFPGTLPARMGPHLETHGLMYHYEGPGMFIDLDRLPQQRMSLGLTIEEVDTASALEDWIKVSARAFDEDTSEIDPRYISFETCLGWGKHLPYRRFLACLYGQPIGTSSIFLGSKVAGLYSVSTLPEARKRGIGRAISLASLLIARELNYRSAVLQSSPSGYRVYTRLGFRECCQIHSYLWRPAPHP